eukprot:1158399-Pelagomonas_calceolata.AAC.2
MDLSLWGEEGRFAYWYHKGKFAGACFSWLEGAFLTHALGEWKACTVWCTTCSVCNMQFGAQHAVHAICSVHNMQCGAQLAAYTACSAHNMQFGARHAVHTTCSAGLNIQCA